MSDTSATVTSAAVGMKLEAVLARVAAEHVVGTDCKPPFPGESTVGFPGKLVTPTVVLMVSATAVVIGALLAVALGKEKGVGKRWLDSLMGWGQCLVLKELFVAFC